MKVIREHSLWLAVSINLSKSSNVLPGFQLTRETKEHLYRKSEN
jgi:hypothetical protein